ncbi:MAG: phage terminase large subunit family protein [Dysgonamonadaceae bacterium]|jgi:phage terminase large subunit GpA-like protein|nr:phage terminase large subunit family protein [Dysgonamonadaceae bacterium]
MYNEIQGLLDGIRPIPRITVSEWSDEYRYLSPVSSARPGRYNTDFTPYMRKIMDSLSYNSSYKKIIFMKSAQSGGTEAAVNFIGYAIHINPAPIMLVEPNDDMVKKVSKFRIDTLVEMCPELDSRVSKKKSRDSNNSVNQKSFSGGVLFLAGANSAAGLRSVPVRFLILDEVDSYPPDLDGEGSPIDLAIARTRTFPNKKIFIISTPTNTGVSAIEREFNETDQNYFYVPCPHCGEMQRLIFEQLIWDEGKPDTVRYYCSHCGAGIEEYQKETMLVRGEWRPVHPELSTPETIGFHINSLYAPHSLYSWREIVDEWLKAQKDPNKLKVFVNTVLAETWAECGEAPPYKNLFNRRENYPFNLVPDDVCFLTAGVDVQRDRLELEIVGWCADKRSYSIDYRVLEGDTAGENIWNQLAAVIEEHFLRSDGVEFPIYMVCVDSGFNTSHVYNFCRRYNASRVVPIKGQDNLGVAVSYSKQVDTTKAGKRIGKVKLVNIGVSFLKSELYSNLRLEKDSDGTPPPNFCHFPEYPEHYFRGLTAEEQVTKIIKGYTRSYWRKVYERNEPLDCRIYARAAAAIVGLDRLNREQLQAMIRAPRNTPQKNQAKPTQAANLESESVTQDTKISRRTFWNR